MAQNTIYSVTEITRAIKQALEHHPIFKSTRITGEVSNLTRHSSGHVYFSLKDRGAQISCVMFRSFALYAPSFKVGDKLVLTGGISVYEPRGNYQFLVRAVEKARGKGSLFEAFTRLKEGLAKEGLFDNRHKKAIPQFPSFLAVITSPTGAAVKDILRTIHRRYSKVKVVLIPTTVQGEHGKASILKSLQNAISLKPDTIILGRGGGSIEDLWNFNEEEVARAIFHCPIPIITGIGHETDFTIADFVADLRASTPTAAAEKAVPDLAAIVYTLSEYQKQIRTSLQHFIDYKRQLLDDYSFRMGQSCQQFVQSRKHSLQIQQTQLLQAFSRNVSSQSHALRMLQKQLETTMLQSIREKRHALKVWETKLQSMDRSHILRQGYTLTLKNKQIVSDLTALQEGDSIETVFEQGRVKSIVQDINKT